VERREQTERDRISGEERKIESEKEREEIG